MKKLKETLNTHSAYYLLHAAIGISLGDSIVLVYYSWLTGLWAINTYVVLIWSILAQTALSYVYHRYYGRGTRFLFKGIGVTCISAGIIISGAWILQFYGA